ncbi:MAG TPA: ferritin-like domain-containing protein [Acidimicrobiia bacterium]|nr:ferritin-like domain-containing protein [Acidimicrobiia bacterium]
MALDDTRLRDLLTQSHDLHSDAMETTRVALDEYVELAHDEPLHDDSWADVDPVTRRTTLLRGLPKSGVLAAAGLGTAMVALLASPAFANKTMDVQMLQTAASIENLAIATYDTALTLDFIGGASANAVVKAFVQKTKEQHQQHAEAFNAAVTRLGGKAQDQPDPVLLGVVNNAKPSLTGPAQVVDLAIELEDGAAQTYVANTGTYSNKNARIVTASIMGVEAQHVAILNAVKALLAGGAADLIALPPDAAKLPAAAGSVGFPNAFYPTTDARPANEGAMQ